MDPHHDLGGPVAARRQGVRGGIGGEGGLAGLVLGGGAAEAAAQFRGREGLRFGAFGAHGGEEGGIGVVERFEGVEMRLLWVPGEHE